MFNCPNAEDPPVVTYCENCFTPIRVGDEYVSDEDNNVFCDDECFKKFHGYGNNVMEV